MPHHRNILSGFGALAAVLVLAGAPSPASAQTATTRLRGTIERIDGSDLKVVLRDGTSATLHLPDAPRVLAVKRAELSDVKAGSFVGIAALPRPDGTQMALEVLIFPEAMRGAGEGHRPWDLMPESTMTNATVAETVVEANGSTLKLAYKDGAKTITVPPQAPIVTFAPADKTDLKPGTKFFCSAEAGASAGDWKTAAITVGRDGVDPPM